MRDRLWSAMIKSVLAGGLGCLLTGTLLTLLCRMSGYDPGLRALFAGFLISVAVGLAVGFAAGRALAGGIAGSYDDLRDSQIAELKRAEQMRMDFTANVSHELKTPLTSIRGFTEMLGSGIVKDEETRQRFITMISVEVDRLIFLINDILKLSELEQASIDRTELSSSAIEAARSAAEMLEPSAEGAGVTIEVTGCEGSVAVDGRRLQELFLNLIENAIKYNEPGGSVQVRVEECGSGLALSVSDTGIGIPKEHQDRVFERFYRVDKGRSKKTGGTGLGLAIVKHIVQLYGGRLELESEPGKGTRISAFFEKTDVGS